MFYVLILNTCLTIGGGCEYHVEKYFYNPQGCTSERSTLVLAYNEANYDRRVRQAICGTRRDVIQLLGMEV